VAAGAREEERGHGGDHDPVPRAAGRRPGVKVVASFVHNWKLGLPSELALLTPYDPRTGVPRAIIDVTEITEGRTER
jgi:ornithine cyclodeaminase/alanine dehydrogenase-like protein (mu-crystallin family)